MKQVLLPEEDHEWLASMLVRIRRKMYANASQYSVEQNAQIERVVAAFNEAEKYVEPKAPAPAATGSKPAPKKTRRSKTEPVALPRNACRDHPRYGAARVPRSDCEGCWAFYKALHPTSYPQAILKFQREQRRKAKTKKA